MIYKDVTTFQSFSVGDIQRKLLKAASKNASTGWRVEPETRILSSPIFSYSDLALAGWMAGYRKSNLF
jgi:hypothetical protein